MLQSIILREEGLPAASNLLAEEEFLARTGLALERLHELIRLDWLNLVRTQETLLYRPADVRRARKLERLCDDFELPALGGAIIVDLLDRISILEQELKELRSR